MKHRPFPTFVESSLIASATMVIDPGTKLLLFLYSYGGWSDGTWHKAGVGLYLHEYVNGLSWLATILSSETKTLNGSKLGYTASLVEQLLDNRFILLTF